MKFLIDVCQEGTPAYTWGISIEGKDFYVHSMNDFFAYEDAFTDAAKFCIQLDNIVWNVKARTEEEYENIGLGKFPVSLYEGSEYDFFTIYVKKQGEWGWYAQFVGSGPNSSTGCTSFNQDRDAIMNMIDLVKEMYDSEDKFQIELVNYD